MLVMEMVQVSFLMSMSDSCRVLQVLRGNQVLMESQD